jgi:MFS family permease
VWQGWATIPVLYTAFLLFGMGETLADSTSVALLPSIVPAEGLARANARLLGTYLIGNQLAAPPFGAWLFVAAPALPFALDAASFLAAALLLAPLLRPRSTPRPEPRSRRTLRAEIVQGLGWLWRHRTLRLLALCVGVMNLAGAGSFAIWVLWARERLGVQGVGFGVLVTAYTAGGLLGTMLASPLERRFGPATLLRAGLCIEAASQLSLALAGSPWVAAPTLVAFGAHATVWGVVSVSLRQRIVPEPLRGRVNSVYFLFDLGGAALGTLLGGGLASALGITAPFWLGAGAVAVLAVTAWPRLTAAALAGSAPTVAPWTASGPSSPGRDGRR